MVRIGLPKRKRKKRVAGEISSFQIFMKSWSGKIGLTLLVIQIILAVFAIGYYGIGSFRQYTTSNLWYYLNTPRAPPCWIVDKAPPLRLTADKMNHTIQALDNASSIPWLTENNKTKINKLIKFVNGYAIYEKYEGVFRYSAEGDAKPKDVALALVFHNGNNTGLGKNFGRSIFIYVHLERPDGRTITIFKHEILEPAGVDFKLIGDYARDIVFLNKRYNYFIKPVGLSNVKSSGISLTSILASTVNQSVKALLTNLTGSPDKASQLLKNLGPGTAMLITIDNGKVKVLPGEYKFSVELVYLVKKNVVVDNSGKFNVNIMKKNDAYVEARALAFVIKANCGGWFGTDEKGRPIGLGLLFGLPYAFLLGFIVTFTSTFIGAIYGSAAGYWKDLKGEALMRVVDIVNSLPFLPILIALSIAVGRINLWALAALMIALFWAGPVIVVRSMALQISEQIYVEAARAVGASSRRILFKHIFPQVFPYTMAIAVLSMPGVIIAEASLSILGLGDPTAPTWGKLLEGAYSANAVLQGMWWYYIFPGLALLIFSATFLIIGRALEPIVSPKLIK